jgi:hypothetical protein
VTPEPDTYHAAVHLPAVVEDLGVGLDELVEDDEEFRGLKDLVRPVYREAWHWRGE